MANPEDTYHVYWNGSGKDHEKAMLTMLRFNLFPAETAHWLGETICREIDGFLQSGGKESVFSQIVAKADMRSTAEDRKMGQWNYRIESKVDKHLHNVFTAFKRLLYATTQSRDERGRPLPIRTENENVITGWDCNFPDSALFYPDYKHLFIRWDRLLDVRMMMEEFNSGQPVFDLSVKTRDLSVAEKEEERVKVVQALQHSNYLELPLPGAPAGNGNKAIAWKVHPIDRKTGEILEAIDCICLDKSARDELFRDADPIIFHKNSCCIDWGSAKCIGIENDQEDRDKEISQPQTQEEIPSPSISPLEIPNNENDSEEETPAKDPDEQAIAELAGASENNPVEESSIGPPLVGNSEEEAPSSNKEKRASTKQNPSMDSIKPKTKPNKGVVNLSNLGKMKAFDFPAESEAEASNEDKPKSVMGSFMPTTNQKSIIPKPFPAYGKKRKGVVLSDRIQNVKKKIQTKKYTI